MPNAEQYKKYKEYYRKYKKDHAEENRLYQRKRRGSKGDPRYINDAISLLRDFQVCRDMTVVKEEIRALKTRSECDRYVRALIDEKLKSV